MEWTFNRHGRLAVLAPLLTAFAACGVGGKVGVKITEKGPPPVELGTCTGGPTSVSIAHFPENPRTANPALAFNAALGPSHAQSTTLHGLTGNCLLESSLFSVTENTIFPDYIVTVRSTNQVYSPAQPQFQQLNGLFHASSLQRLLSSLGADLSSSGKFTLDTNCNFANNAFFLPSERYICLGYVNQGGGRRVWAADDADVVIHEAGHGVNHALAGTSTFYSSGEAGALDEALADYWALTILNDPELSEWFLGSLGASYIRDAGLNHAYPASMVYEVHDDSRVISETLWSLRASLGKTVMDSLVRTALDLLPATTRFAEFYRALYDASGPSFLNLSSGERAEIVAKFIAKGLHRTDSAGGLQLATTRPAVYVIDDHTLSAQAGGNCNGALDVGETALVLVNLENTSGAELGVGVATLGTAPAGVVVPNGGQLGEYFRFPANGDFVSALPTGSSREDATLMAAFLLRATSAGPKVLSFTFRPTHADPTGVAAPSPDISLTFSVTVGTAATSSSCSNAGLWP